MKNDVIENTLSFSTIIFGSGEILTKPNYQWISELYINQSSIYIYILTL